ncbi:MAG: cytochrome c [Candidatus Eremiobacterota bacterium]
MKRLLLVLLLTLPGVAQPPRMRVEAPPFRWPPGPEAKLLETRCQICHGPEIIAGQRLTQAQWTKSLDKMASWGATLTPDEKSRLVDYLTRHCGPDTAVTLPPRVRLVGP